MALDISSMTAEELDELISAASNRREQLLPAVPMEQPQGEVRVVGDPKWYVTNTAAGTLLQLRHPGRGWTNYMIPALNRSFLLSALLQNATAPQLHDNSGSPTPTSGGGSGTVH